MRFRKTKAIVHIFLDIRILFIRTLIIRRKKMTKRPFTIALVGNPNCGKTTLFNLLTKSGEPVGNRAGVTFSAKKEPLRQNFHVPNTQILDLPGIYSLSGGKNEEKITLDALKKEPIDVILNIIDATNLERGLYLTLALSALGIPMVAALNMMDEVKKDGGAIDISALEKALQIPVFPISAAKAQGIRSLLLGCLHTQKIPSPILFSNRAEAEETIRSILSEAIKKQGVRSRFEDRIDACICRPIIGIPLFFAVMCAVFFLTFSSLGNALSAYMEHIFSILSVYLQNWLSHLGSSAWLCRFIVDGVWMGIASVLSFIPQTAILFFLLAFLEDSGYLARAVSALDHVMKHLGVSGKAIIPLIIGFGCTVPAVLATSTLEASEKERTAASLPFIPCNARLPVILLLSASFFEEHSALFAISLYLLCVGVSFLSLSCYRSKEPSNDAPPLIMELPRYRMPRLVNLLREVKNKLKDFLVRAGTVVFLSCVVVDLLAMLKPNLQPIENSSESILACLGNTVAPFFSIFGFGDGRIVAALAAGFFAKESIVSTIQILIPEGLSAVISASGAFSLAVFSLLYVPCAATLGAFAKEFGKRKAFFLFLRTFLIACIVTLLSDIGLRLLSK